MLDPTPSAGAARVALVRHGPFYSDPRLTKEALALARSGATVHVFARGPEVDPWLNDPRIVVHTITRSAVSERAPLIALQALAFGVRVLGRLLWARRPFDVVVVHSIPSWLLQLLAPVRLRVPGPRLVLDHHEPEAEMLREAGVPASVVRAYRAIESASLRLADGVVDVSPEMAARSRGLGARRQFVVDNAPQMFGVSAGEDIVAPVFDLGVFGSLIARYDLGTLAAALAEVGCPVGILQVGVGPMALRVNPTGGDLERIEYLPPPSLQGRLRTCRVGFVGLAPSDFTDLVSPNRLWELAALGVPAVVASTSLTRALLGDGAFFYEGGVPRSLRDTLRRALDATDDARARVAEVARGRLAARFWSAQEADFVRFCLDPGPVENVA